jgi:hypothetical protein
MDGYPPSSQSAVSTFIVRIWRVWSLRGPHWRGRIEHLQSGQHAAFEDLDRMLAFVRASGVLAENQGLGRADEASGDE